jgi:hypothetical protein
VCVCEGASSESDCYWERVRESHASESLLIVSVFR